MTPLTITGPLATSHGRLRSDGVVAYELFDVEAGPALTLTIGAAAALQVAEVANEVLGLEEGGGVRVEARMHAGRLAEASRCPVARVVIAVRADDGDPQACAAAAIETALLVSAAAVPWIARTLALRPSVDLSLLRQRLLEHGSVL